MKRIVAAAIFALLAVTAPARAMMVYTLSLEFGSGSTADASFNGTITFNSNNIATAANGIINGPGLASPYTPTPADLTLSTPCCALYPGAPSLGGPYYDVTLIGTGPSGDAEAQDTVSFVYSIRNGAPALFEADAGVAVWNSILGTDRSIGGTLSPPPSPVPLPAALPLFGSALAGLGGFGWLKRRGKVSRTRCA